MKKVTEFLRPSRFVGDPYGYVTNQISHAWLGFVLTTIYVLALRELTGTYPPQTMAVISVTLAYIIGWEWGFQRWSGWDSIEDVLFVFGGASLYLLFEMDIVLDRLIAFIMATSFILAIGAARRLRQ